MSTGSAAGAVRTAGLGETIRVQISRGGGTDQVWAELTVEHVVPGK